MTSTLVFLHTAPALVPTFDALIKEAAPDIPVEHIVAEDLLVEARETGMTPQLADRISGTVLNAVDHGASVVLCTCSSIGGPAEGADARTEATVIRVDRPMAEKAVAIGSRITIVATLTSTLAPTIALVLDAAQKAGKEIEVTEVVCEAAFPKFQSGDVAGYNREIADTLTEVASGADVIVLAQASMAGAAALCPDLPVPVLSSPPLGVAAAVEAYRRG